MKGQNTLNLNKATMIEAVQEWLNARYQGPAPEVTNVTATRDITETFEVTLCAPKEKE